MMDSTDVGLQDALVPIDRDPTFAARISRDSVYWSKVLGVLHLSPAALHRYTLDGFEFAPASMPAVRHLNGATEVQTHVVIVPGGLSSVRSGWSDLLARRPVSRPWHGLSILDDVATWRFEHDSFLPLMRNAEHLVEAIDIAILRNGGFDTAPPRIALIAHSRGGIVACVAAGLLKQRRPDAVVHAFTFGTPHAGTLVFRRIGQRWFWLARILGVIQRTIGGILPSSAAIGLDILRRALCCDIPLGFQDVEPEQIADLVACTLPLDDVTAWSSRWLNGTWLARMIGAITGFELHNGDGLVSCHADSKSWAANHDASPVFHTGYFRHRRAMAQLYDYLSHFVANTYP